MSSNTAFVNRSLTSIHNELEFLKDSGAITERLYEHLNKVLPARYNPESSPIDLVTDGGPLSVVSSQLSQGQNQLSQVPSQTPPPYGNGGGGEEVAEALYEYRKDRADDLPFFKGDQIVVVEKRNPEWWTGRNLRTNEHGVFPSSYVRIISGGGPSGQTEKSYGGYPGYTGSSYGPGPQGPVYNQGPGYAQGSGYVPPFPPSSTGYYGGPPAQQGPAPVQAVGPPPEQQQQQPQQQHHLPSGVKKFGSKLGNAAIFGAGATIGSDIVNSIF